MIKNLRIAQDFLSLLQNIIAPPRCMGCLKENTWLCRPCVLDRPSFTPTCIICKESSPRGMTCNDCRDTTPLSGVMTAGPYGSPILRRGIHWLKFKNVQPVAFPLAQLLVLPLLEIAPLPVLQKSAIITPIPLHKKKENQRGFNQSLLIAQELSRLTQIPLYPILDRQKHTLTQTKLPLNLREKNTAGAFRLHTKVPSQTRFTILLDDVTTSGSTLEAAAKAMPNQKEVWGLTIAKG